MKIFFNLPIVIAIALALSLTVFAHPGKTDSTGGHTDHSTGEYHYHHGYSAHSHEDFDGDEILDCPYDFDDRTDHSTGNSYKKSFSTWSQEKTETTKVTTPTPTPTKAPQKQFNPSNDPLFLLGLIIFSCLIVFLPAIINDFKTRR